MKSSRIQINSDSIAVYESTGSGSPVLLIHGNSADAETFRYQLGGDFGARYHVIALDLPGHGNSSAAADAETIYCLGGYADVVVEFVERLGIKRPVLVGWSLGGHIVLEAADRLRDAAGFMIYGAPPLGIPPAMDEAFLPNPDMTAAFSRSVNEEQAQALAGAFVRPGSDAPPSFCDAILSTDGRARASLGASVGAANYKDEVRIVANMETPLAILHGAEEQLVNLEYFSTLTIPSLWRGGIQIVEGAGHAVHWEQPEQFNAILSEFMDEVGQNT